MNGSFKTPILVLGLAGVLLSWPTARAQGDPAGFAQALPADIKWAANPAIPAGGQTAVLLGDPRKAGPYVVRTKFPANYKMMSHTHPDDRTYTVISGTLSLGFGDKFEGAKLKSYPAGSVFTVPANAPHFNSSGASEVVFQINSLGPSGTAYVNPADDPRKN